jgi:hypothetical protein
MACHLPAWQHLHDDIRHHVFSEAVCDADASASDHLTDVMISHVDVLGSRMKIVVHSELEDCLVVTEEWGLTAQTWKQLSY